MLLAVIEDCHMPEKAYLDSDQHPKEKKEKSMEKFWYIYEMEYYSAVKNQDTHAEGLGQSNNADV